MSEVPSNHLDNELKLSIAFLIKQSFAEGLGKRFVLYLSPLETSTLETSKQEKQASNRHQNLSQRIGISSIFKQINALKSQITGLSIITSDPKKQAEALAELARQVKSLDLDLMIYSKRSLAELKSLAVDHKPLRMLLFHTDYIVEQGYLPQLKSTRYAWQGSSNQSLHILNPQKIAMEPVFQQQKPSVELRMMPLLVHEDSKENCLFRNGWPHHLGISHKSEKIKYGQFKLEQIKGKQWIEDLLYREYPSLPLDAQWQKDDTYWGLVLSVCKQRCMKWLIETTLKNRLIIQRKKESQNSSEDILRMLYPYISLEDTQTAPVKVCHPFDQELHRFPLMFASVVQAIFSGPQLWKKSILDYESRTQRRAKQKTTSAFNHDKKKPKNRQQSREQNREQNSSQKREYGDWILVLSFYYKFMQPKMMNWICNELLERKTKARSLVISWLFKHSPLLALFEARLGIKYLKKLISEEPNFLDQTTQDFLKLVCPILHLHWSQNTYIERVAEGYYSADTWSHLAAITDLSSIASDYDFYALADACMHTVSKVLSKVEVEAYFMLSAPSMSALQIERARRIQIVRITQAWIKRLQEAQSVLYGDEEYPKAQVLLSFSKDWQSYHSILRPFCTYAEMIKNSG